LSLYGGYGGEFEGSAKIESSWLLSGRLGALLDKDTLLYGRIGFGQADGSWSATFGQSEHHGDLPTFSTIAYGAGLEHRFADGQGAVRIEYRHVDFSKEEAFSFGPADCVTRGTIEPSFDMGLIGVSWRLGR
jgi:opacity protein-like surface antigen